MLNGGLACIALVLSFVGGWLFFILRKLRRLEDKQIIDEAYADAKKIVDSQSLEQLVRNTNEKANRKKSG